MAWPSERGRAATSAEDDTPPRPRQAPQPMSDDVTTGPHAVPPLPTEPARPSKVVIPQPVQIVEGAPWWASTQVKTALGIGIAGIVAVAHCLCDFHVAFFCLLGKLTDQQVASLAAGAGGIFGIGVSVYLIKKRVKAGLDPTNTAAPLTLK